MSKRSRQIAKAEREWGKAKRMLAKEHPAYLEFIDYN